MISIVLFLFGIFIGSFLNVVIDRVPREETIWVGRSHCDYCQHVLSWYDLIPLFSFLLLRGTCRYCHRFIGWKYPIIEATTGITFALVGLVMPITSMLLFWTILSIVACLIIIFYTDLFSGIIPDVVLLVLLPLALLHWYAVGGNILMSLVTGLISGLGFFALYAATKGKGIGFGDVKYAAVMGVLLGIPSIIVGFYVAFLTGAGIALILVMVKKKSFASAIPFGPFLVFGTIVNIFWGSYLWTVFLHLLNL